MNCPKHPHQKMTLLFTSSVCDVCDPPKETQKKADVFGPPTPDWNDLLWKTIAPQSIPALAPVFWPTTTPGNDYRNNMQRADLVLRFDRISVKIFVEKNRYGDPTISTDDYDLWNALHPMAQNVLVPARMPGYPPLYERLLFLVGK